MPVPALQPDLGNERFLRLLDLPILSKSVFCYYVTEKWARVEIQNSVNKSDNEKKKKKTVDKSEFRPSGKQRF